MRAIGIILAGGNSTKMMELSNKRAIAAMPVAGSYRAIDFALSNMSNSYVQKVAVLTQYNARSLNEHLSSSKWWDFGRKQGGLFVFNPTITPDNGFWYQGTADAIAQNLNFLKSSHEPYVVIASGDGVYKMDYGKALEYHINKHADITVVTKVMPDGTDVSRFGIVKVDENNRITDMEEKPLLKKSNRVSIGVYIIRRRQLIELLEKATSENRDDLVTDIIIRYKDVKNIYAYDIDTYWNNISTVESYFRTNMDFLKKEVRDHFRSEPRIYSKVEDLAPAKFNPGSFVRNSLVASGSIVNAHVENSLLFKEVFVGSGCTIRNSVILNDVYIGDGTVIENCIVEAHGAIAPGSKYIGRPDDVLVVTGADDKYSF
ncbi:MAG: glucose-1-phosphate adenylyltransferase subunit GlgD [Lachnospiraceae bacterium]|nr:glucose-1-phosphate adenylyltransferase subunit GlgD [Lachnospiraceae bacterium]